MTVVELISLLQAKDDRCTVTVDVSGVYFDVANVVQGWICVDGETLENDPTRVVIILEDTNAEEALHEVGTD